MVKFSARFVLLFTFLLPVAFGGDLAGRLLQNTDPVSLKPLTEPDAVGMEIKLTEGRQESRELPFDETGLLKNDPLVSVASAGGLWAVRANLSRAVEAASRGNRAAMETSLKTAVPSRTGLDDIPAYLRLCTSARSARLAERAELVVRLVDFSRQTRMPALSLTALHEASLLATSPSERGGIRSAYGLLPAAPNTAPRYAVRRALVEANIAESESTRLGVFTSLLELVPDAPERFPSLFDERSIRLFERAVRQAPFSLRASRARLLIPRKTNEAVDLITPWRDLPPGDRFAAIEILFMAGRLYDVRKEIQALPAETLTPEAAQRLPALALSTQLRLALLRVSPRAAAAPSAPSRDTSKKRGKRGKKKKSHITHAPSVQPQPSISDLFKQTGTVLVPGLPQADQKRVLSDAARLAAAMAQTDNLRGFLLKLSDIDKTTTAGADSIFSQAFRLYRTGGREGLLEAARLLELQGALYEDPSVKRRAVYWAARARAKSGDEATARNLFASLLTGSTADLYGRWAAASLGVPFPAQPAPAAGFTPLSGSTPGPPERELLATGLADVAEETAEILGRRDPVFLAACAYERREFRRAAGILKGRYPQLGTPGEGMVPLAIRKLYYPYVHAGTIGASSRSHEVPASLVLGLIRQESIFEADAKSWAGALGLMQVMPSTGRFLYRRENGHGTPDLLNPSVNVQLGTRYLSDMLRMFEGDVVAALAAYNAGPGRVKRWRREMSRLDMDEFVESIPLSEPRDYVKRVLFFKSAYAELYGLPAPVEVERGHIRRFQVRLTPSR